MNDFWAKYGPKKTEEEEEKDRDQSTLSFWEKYGPKAEPVTEETSRNPQPAEGSLVDRLEQRGVTIELPEPEEKKATERAGTTLAEAAAKGKSGSLFTERMQGTSMTQRMQQEQAAAKEEEKRKDETVRNSEWLSSLRSAEDIQADLDAVKAEQSALDKKAFRDNALGVWYDLIGQNDKTVRANEETKAAREGLTEREQALENELAERKWADYESRRNNKDFAEKSAYKSTANGQETKLNPLGGYDSVGYDDPLYEYVNGNEEAGQILAMEQEENARQNGILGFLVPEDTYNYEQVSEMTDDERAMYNYIHETEGSQAAYEYLDYLRSDLYKRQMEKAKDEAAAYANEHPVLSTVATVGLSPLRGAAYLGQTAQFLTEGKVDENAPYNRVASLPEAERETVTNLVENKWGKAGTFAYGVGVSMAEFLLNSALSGGGTSNVGEAFSLLLMGSGAAADATIEAKERGLSDLQSYAIGSIAGLAEILTEKISIEALFNGKWETEPLRYLLKNTLSEGSEEVGSDLINWFADIMIAGDKGEWKQSIARYKAEGLSDRDALIAALKDKGTELLTDAASGALSGFLMAVGPSAAGIAQKNQDRSKAIEAVRAANNEARAQQAQQTVRQQTAPQQAAPQSAVAAAQTQTAPEGGIVLPTAAETAGEADAGAQMRVGAEPETASPLRTAEETELDERVRNARNVTEATGIRYGVDERTIRKAERIGRMIGRTVLFYEQGSKNGTAENGFFNPKTGEIYYNVNAKQKLNFTLGHEFAHTVEGTEAYENLHGLVLGRLAEDGIDVAERREKVRSIYERAGITGMTNAEIDQELVADYVGEHLSDERTIREICREDPSLGKRLRDTLDDFVTRAAEMQGVVTGYEEQKLRNTVAMYDKYLRRIEAQETAQEAQEGVQSAEEAAEGAEAAQSVHAMQVRQTAAQTARQTQTVPGMQQNAETEAGQETPDEYLARMGQLLEEGEITEDEYDEAVDLAEEMRDTGMSVSRSTVERDAGPEGKIPAAMRRVFGRQTSISDVDENGNRKYSVSDDLTREDVKELKTLGSKNVNDFTSEDLRKTAKIAQKYYEELGVKSPFFRAYFGDWRVNEKNHVKVATKKGDTRGLHHNNDTGWDINRSAKLSWERHNSAASRSGYSFLPYIDEIIENAVLLNSTVSDNENETSAFFHDLYAVLDVDGERNILKLIVEEQENPSKGTLRRAYKLTDIQKYQPSGIGSPKLASSQTAGIPISIAELAEIVKTYDENYNPKEPSKVVNDDGTPKVMYHGTNASRDFNLFNTYGSNYGLYGAGSYFTDNPEVASSYAENKGHGKAPRVYPVYLNIRNPIVMENDADVDAWLEAVPGIEDYITDGNNEITAVTNRDFYKAMEQVLSDEGLTRWEAAENAMDTLMAMGYDGIRHVGGMFRGEGMQHDVWIAFDPTQIKSATGNRGTFDPEDGDIRYSVSDEQEQGPIASLPQAKLRDAALRAENRLAANLAAIFGVTRNRTKDEYKTFKADVVRPVIEAMLQGQAVDADALFREHFTGSLTEGQKARADFDEAMKTARGDLIQMARKANEVRAADEARAKRNAEIDAQIPGTTEDLVKLGNQFKDAKKMRAAVLARTVLTEEDQQIVDALVRGYITDEEAYARNPYGIDDILKAADVEWQYRKVAEVWQRYQRRLESRRIETADTALENADRWDDKNSGFAYARETPERNLRDIAGEDAKQLIDTYIRPIHKSEAESTRYKNAYIKRVTDLGLSRKVGRGNTVSEAAAVQWLGEAEDNVRVLERMRNKDAVRDGQTLDEWKSAIEQFRAENPDLDYAKVRRGIEEFQKIYGELIEQMNRALVENGYEPVNIRSGYFPHFNGGDDGVLAKFAHLLGIKLETNALPTSINGLTSSFKPGKTWFGHAQERTGFHTDYDAVQGFEGYIGGVSDVIHQTANIRNIRTLSNRIRYKMSDEGIRNRINEIRANDTLTQNEKDQMIEDLTANGRYKLSRAVAWLDEYANLLANKKSRYDRGIEDLMGRKVYTWMKNIEGRVAANMIAGNLGSALTNFIPLNQAASMIGDRNLIKGAAQTVANMIKGDGFVNRSDFLVNRRGTDPLIQNRADKIAEFLSAPMNLIDNFASEAIVRGAYNYYRKRGMDDESALDAANEFAAGVMADRSKGALPTVFGSKNPMMKLFTQFQVEVNNEFSTIFKDVPKGVYRNDKDRKNMVAVAAWTLLRYFIGAYLFNDLYESIVGRRAALDPLDILNDTVGDLTGKKLNNIVDMLTGEGILEEQKRANPSDAITETGKNVLEELPFVGGLLGGGRIPISSALPDAETIVKGLSNENWSASKKAQTVGRELGKTVGTYILPPFAGGALKKAYQTAENTIAGGRFVKNAEGEDQIQYPYFTETPAETAGTVAKSLLFGPTATEGGREWVERGFGSQSAKNTALYRQLTESGESQRDAWDLISGMSGLNNGEKRDFIAQANISEEGKAMAMETMLSESEGKKFRGANEYGVSAEAWAALYDAMADYDTNYNNSYSQKEIVGALEAIRIPLGEGAGMTQGMFGGSTEDRYLTDREKAVLWAAYGYKQNGNSWKQSNNPYDPTLGEAVIDWIDGLVYDEEEEGD